MISGINQGSNLGEDAFYSGTVAAAVEAAISGIPSFAISIDNLYNTDFSHAVTFAERLASFILSKRTERTLILNVNVPSGIPLGVKFVPLSNARYVEEYEKILNPRKREFYWLKGELKQFEEAEESDVECLKKGFITITPLLLNITDYDAFKFILDWNL